MQSAEHHLNLNDRQQNNSEMLETRVKAPGYTMSSLVVYQI